MQRRQGRFSRTRLILLTSSVITLISQVYFNAFSDQFRLSLSVVLFPLLLLAAWTICPFPIYIATWFITPLLLA